MENQKNTNNLKAIIAILSVLLLGSLGYMYKMSSDAKDTQTVLVGEKDAVMKDLSALKESYDKAIAENTSLSDELIAEREKVVKLMEELEKSKGDVASLRKFKQQYQVLEGEKRKLMAQVDELTKANTRLTEQRDSTIVVLDESKKYNEVLVGQNTELSKAIEKGSKLSVLNLKTSAYKQRNSGKQIETDKASRADVLKINFTIAENQIAQSGDRTYYVQVIDSRNNVLGEKKTETFGSQSLTYSFAKTVNYENKTVDVSEDLPGKDYAKGNYFVNIFDSNGELVSKSSFSLR
jgi:DNA repair exonuclease SbcCD ATPase subunit